MTSVSSSRPRCLRSLTSAALRLVDFAGRRFSKSLLEVLAGAAVAVPVGVVELDEAHAALDEPAGEQAVVGEATACRARRRTARASPAISPERSISSGALVCMRYAIS